MLDSKYKNNNRIIFCNNMLKDLGRTINRSLERLLGNGIFTWSQSSAPLFHLPIIQGNDFPYEGERWEISSHMKLTKITNVSG
jgi:hypothetical protein